MLSIRETIPKNKREVSVETRSDGFNFNIHTRGGLIIFRGYIHLRWHSSKEGKRPSGNDQFGREFGQAFGRDQCRLLDRVLRAEASTEVVREAPGVYLSIRVDGKAVVCARCNKLGFET